MEQDRVGLAFAAGLVAALNPCGFAMLPAYLTLVVRGEGRAVAPAVGRALAATAAMTLGFLAVFGGFGLLTVSASALIAPYLPYVTVAIGVALVAAGCWMLAGRNLGGVVAGPSGRRFAPSARLGSMFGYGAAFAIASLSCTIAPFLAVTGAALSGGSPASVASTYLGYTAGFALVVGALSIAAAFATSALADRLRRIAPNINRIGGLVLVLVGLYVGYYGVHELRLYRGDAGPDDPVVATVGRVAGSAAGWVFRHGAWPWLAASAVVVAGAAWMWHRNRVKSVAPPTESALTDTRDRLER